MPNRNPSPANAGPGISHAGPSSAAGSSGTAAGPSTAAGAAAAGAAGGTSKPEIPWAFIDCPTDTLVVLISHMLDLLIQHNDQVVLTPDALTRFHSRAAPGISVIDYLRRIVKYTNMEKIPLLSLLSYIDITCNHLPTFTLSSLTVHRFLIAGVCAGSKAQCDVFCTNSHYAKVGGIKVGELNALEREFLRVTKWNLCCNSDLLQKYYSSLIKSHGGFTQAAEPTVPPFRPFPRSNSKPRASQPADEGIEVDENAAGPSGTSGLDAEQGTEAPDEEMRDDEGQPAADGDGMEQDEPERQQDEIEDGGAAREEMGGSGEAGGEGSRAAPGPPIIESTSSSVHVPNPSADTFQADQPQTDGMDVDPEPPDSGSAPAAAQERSDPTSLLAQSADSHSGSALHSFPSRSSLQTDASSSIPSSSASSIRRASIGGSSTFTVKQGGAASPRLDTTSASGSASGRTAAQASSGNHDHDALPPATPPLAISNGSSSSRPIARTGMARSEGAIASSGQSADSNNAHHGPHGGKLLKHLVGGIFGKRHHHATPADSVTATPSSSSGVQTPVANAPATGGNTLSRSIKRHVSGPTPTTTPLTQSGKPGGTTGASGPTTNAAAGPHGDRVLSPRPGDRRERDAGPSPRMSPGLARLVTPRIRTRDEVSAEGVKS